ncbi:MAG: YafY family protein [Opitutales bacterium]|jgi:predicted DNA-binding transcriptional regulator YafY|nr:YafY family protein [Opitutales bacterium]
MNRIDRLTAMILALQSHRVVTAEQLSERFELSVRTIYRDLAALGEAGVPIVAEAGVGYSLMRGYHMPPIMFTEEEAAALFMSGQLSEKFGDDSQKIPLRDALLKVCSVLPEKQKHYLSTLDSRIGVWGPADDLGNHKSMMPVQKAVVRRRCLKIHYDTGSRGKVNVRTVEPLGLMFCGIRWHLVAWCRLRKDLRDSRLDRMVELKVLEETFSGHENFSLHEFVKRDIEGSSLAPFELRCERWALLKFISKRISRSLVDQAENVVGSIFFISLQMTLQLYKLTVHLIDQLVKLLIELTVL